MKSLKDVWIRPGVAIGQNIVLFPISHHARPVDIEKRHRGDLRRGSEQGAHERHHLLVVGRIHTSFSDFIGHDLSRRFGRVQKLPCLGGERVQEKPALVVQQFQVKF